MSSLNLSRCALSVCAAVLLLTGCGGAQVPSTPVPPMVTNAGILRAVPALGGVFSGAYSGTWTYAPCFRGRHGSQISFSGAGNASFLRRSKESAVLGSGNRTSCGLGWDGSATLTSSKHPANAIYVKFPQQIKAMCQDAFSYTVNGGTGKFVKATGSGSVTFKCSFRHKSGPYSDQWSGTLSF